VTFGSDNVVPATGGGHAEGIIPGHVLSQYHVIFDYPHGTFTLAKPGVLLANGKSMPMPVGPRSGGDAKTLGGTTLETMFLPRATWMGEELSDVGVTSQRKGTFETYMTQMMARPIVGSLAGNVLKAFRVELDYPNQKLYISRP
jgi:hypothetical protein